MWVSDMHRHGQKGHYHEEELDVFAAELLGAAQMLLMLFREPKEAAHVLRMMEEYIRSRQWSLELEIALKNHFDPMLHSSKYGRAAAAILGALSSLTLKRTLGT